MCVYCTYVYRITSVHINYMALLLSMSDTLECSVCVENMSASWTDVPILRDISFEVKKVMYVQIFIVNYGYALFRMCMGSIFLSTYCLLCWFVYLLIKLM